MRRLRDTALWRLAAFAALAAFTAFALSMAACDDAPSDVDALAPVDGGTDGARPPTLTAHAWPEADALFEGDPRWIGGDAAYTVDLGGDRVLWLFGDSFIATTANRLRSESVMVRNSIAVQTGRDPTTATAAFHWLEPASPDTPEAYFPEPLETETWLWPLDGAPVGNSVVLFFTRVTRTNTGLGFDGVDWQARRIENPADDPDLWQITALKAPSNPWRIFLGTAVTVRDGYLLAYGMQEPSHDLFVMRWNLAAAEAGQLHTGQWWCGDDGDNTHDSDNDWHVDCEPARLLPSVAAELSVHRDPGTGGWLFTESVGFGQSELNVRLATDPMGPWSTPQVVFRPPEWDWPGALMYAGKAHPELNCADADAVLTYMVNSFDFATLVNDQRYYYPRFVKLEITP
jgi:Domain of unknown function (DUF4185)